jgi:DNA primase
MNIEEYLVGRLEGKVSSKGWFNTMCLSPDHVDTRPSFGIYLETGYGQCFSCGFRAGWIEIIGLIEKMDMVSAAVTANRIAFSRNFTTTKSTARRRKTTIHPYWLSRGLKLSTIYKYGLGHDSETDCVYAPVHDYDGNLAGYVRRRTDTKLYLNDTGIQKSEILVGYHMNRYPIRELYVAEGLIDTFVMNQEGYPTVGRLGWNMSDSQVRALRRTGARVIVVVDNDHLSLKQTKRWTTLGFDVAYTQLPYKDPSEMLQKVGHVSLASFNKDAWLFRQVM